MHNAGGQELQRLRVDRNEVAVTEAGWHVLKHLTRRCEFDHAPGLDRRAQFLRGTAGAEMRAREGTIEDVPCLCAKWQRLQC
jgi:hypothetical protein